MTRRQLSTVASLLVVLVGCPLAAIAIYVLLHCVPAEKLARVTPGITSAETVAILGPPASVTKHSDGRAEMYYSKPLRYCEVYVFVDSADHVTGTFHDH